MLCMRCECPTYRLSFQDLRAASKIHREGRGNDHHVVKTKNRENWHTSLSRRPSGCPMYLSIVLRAHNQLAVPLSVVPAAYDIRER